jgi:hypothetical protein
MSRFLEMGKQKEKRRRKRSVCMCVLLDRFPISLFPCEAIYCALIIASEKLQKK